MSRGFAALMSRGFAALMSRGFAAEIDLRIKLRAKP